jgi:hypothetical protein
LAAGEPVHEAVSVAQAGTVAGLGCGEGDVPGLGVGLETGLELGLATGVWLDGDGLGCAALELPDPQPATASSRQAKTRPCLTGILNERAPAALRTPCLGPPSPE